MYTKKIKIPIFFGTLEVIITKDPKFKKVNKQYNTRANKDFDAFVFRSKGKYCLVIPPDVSASVITHECVHLTNFLFKDKGIIPDERNDEAQAYITSWFYKQVEKVLKQYKKK